MSADNKTLNDIIFTSLDDIKGSLGADTVIGTPIATDNGTTVIPISRVSVGVVTGGMDINNSAQKLGAGTGTGMSVTPVGFLVIKPDGNVDMINVNNPTSAPQNDPVSQIADLIERSPDIVEKIKNLFSKNKNKDGEKTEEQK